MKTITANNFTRLSGKDLQKYRDIFTEKGILSFPGFIDPDAISQIQQESQKLYQIAYKSSMGYNLFVDNNQGGNMAKKRISDIVFNTQKSCVCYDSIDERSILKRVYNNTEFQAFIATIVGVQDIYPYADTLSSININYYNPGDALEWHFDNCEFTITLLIKAPDSGGVYQYFPNKRYLSDGTEDYINIEKMLLGQMKPDTIDIGEGDLVLFRGTESLHRVTEILGGQRILVTFCYNSEPNISLSETSRMTFFGRIR